jgi:hypothetical protein
LLVNVYIGNYYVIGFKMLSFENCNESGVNKKSLRT